MTTFKTYNIVRKVRKQVLHFSLFAFAFSMVFASCAGDDSTVADVLIPGITIGALTADGEQLTVVSYEHNRLTLSPTVTSGYADSELSYDWYLIDVAAENVYHPATDTDYHFDRLHIASGRRLDYEVNLTPGQYTLVFEVKAANGYTASQTATLNAVTNFTQGFYILKETADGQTELDLYNPANGAFLENVVTTVHGQPFSGKPQNLSVATGHSYIDTETNEMASATLVTVTTQDGQIYAMRSSDLNVVHDRQTLLFVPMEADELPYRIVSGSWGNYFVSSRGVRFQYTSSMSLSTSGKYGLESVMKASPYVCYDEGSSNLFFWDADSHSIGQCDYNGATTVAQDERYKLSGLVRMTCAAAGYNAMTGNIVFVLSSLDGSQRQLVLLSSSFTGGVEVQAMRALTVSKINRASLFSVCYSSAALLYGVVDNRIYGLDLTSFTEQAITPRGLDEGEQIVYISNQSGGYMAEHDYLVVGTQQGTRYTLRFYNLLGGLPDGEPVITLSGTGSPRAIHYTTQQTFAFSVIPYQD